MTVAKRIWGNNLQFNIMHDGDVQVYKRYSDGGYHLQGRITEIDPEHDRKYTEYQNWMKDLKKEYRKAGGRKNFGRN